MEQCILMSDTVYQKFLRRWEEVTELPPQTLGPFTPYYKIFVRHLKVMPWPLFVIISIVAILGLYLIVGTTITFFVSVLQRGF